MINKCLLTLFKHNLIKLLLTSDETGLITIAGSKRPPPSNQLSKIRGLVVKGNGVATLAQNKIFPAKQELLLSEITGLPLDAQMQRNHLDVDERVEGSRQCSCSRPS
jgi:hypothetical protein